MSEELTFTFDKKQRSRTGGRTKHDPRIVELVKFLARVSAERDYNELLNQEEISEMKGNPDD